MSSTLSKFQGCLLGGAVGDAVGELAQHHPDWSLETILRHDLAYTDDTALTLALAQAIVEPGPLTTKKIGDAFLAAINREPDRGYGGSPLVFYAAELHRLGYLQARDRVDLALRGGEGSLGDGAAMRVAPVALFFAGRKTLAAKVRRSCVIDHNHPIAVDSCRVVAQLIAWALGPDLPEPRRALGRLQRLCRSLPFRSALATTLELLEAQCPAREAGLRLGNLSRSTTDAHAVVPFAIYCFFKNRGSFERCLADALSSPGDSDTIAAIAGSLSGTFLGVEGIPEKFLTRLEGRERLAALAAQLHLKKFGLAEVPAD